MHTPLSGRQKKTVLRLGRFSSLVLCGVVVTGVWELIARPGTPGLNGRGVPIPTVEPPTTMAWFHWFFGALALGVAIFGAPWLWFRTGRMPHTVGLAIVVFAVCFFSGGWVAYEFAELVGQPPGTEAGYLQFFTNDVAWIATDVGVKSEAEFRIAMLIHVLATPMLVVYWWFSLRVASQTMAEDYAPEATSWGERRDS